MKILITGASGGIGFLTGLVLAQRGHCVIMTTHTKKQEVVLKEKISSLGYSNVVVEKLDITNSYDIEKFKKFDIDVLINHAGIGVGGSIIDLDIDSLRYNFEVNFFSSYNLAKIFLNNLISNNKSGKLIITSSIAGTIPFEFLGSYCSSKAAITMMARVLKDEIKYLDRNIKISVVEPGAYKTGFNVVMIDSANDSIEEDSPFFDKKEEIYDILKLKFSLASLHSLKSIVTKIVLAVEEDNKKFIYSSPFIQRMVKKIYALLKY